MIPPVLNGTRPSLSVMIPTYDDADRLAVALASVLDQDPGPAEMQIEVVDDCSPGDRTATVVAEIGRGRVSVVRNATNLGAVGTFNECLRRSCGELVHILHSDDWLRPNFYEEIQRLATQWPEAGLYATCFVAVDDGGNERWSGGTMPQCGSEPHHDPGPLVRTNPLQFVTTVMRRSAIELSGGFLETLVHTADWEMWLRLTSEHGLAQSRLVGGAFRQSVSSDTSRIVETGANLLDRDRLVATCAFEALPIDVDAALAVNRATALDQYQRAQVAGRASAADAALTYWRDRAPLAERVRFVTGGRQSPLRRPGRGV